MMTFVDFANAVCEMHGRAYFVGGCVRDQIMGREPHDHDLMVVGVEEAEFLCRFPQAEKTGKVFPVFRLDMAEESRVEVAFARSECKVGAGHSGFEVRFGKEVSLEDDLVRRDLTFNALAKDVLTGEVIDLFGGVQDLRAGVVRAIGEHFTEDPVRALRAARQAATFGFEVSPETLVAMRACVEELAREPKERVVGELQKALLADRPSVFFRTLRAGGCLRVCFPEVDALIGQTQPVEWHPEGDAFEHSMQVLDAVAERTPDVVTRFAALMHDIGKGVTPAELLPKHHGHDKAGARIIESLPRAYPRLWRDVAAFTALHHMAVINMKKESKQVALLMAAKKSLKGDLSAFREVVRADSGSVPRFLEESVFRAVCSARVSVDPETMSVEQIRQAVLRARVEALRASL